MSDKVKLYVVSISAASVIPHDTLKDTLYWEHNAAILPDTSMVGVELQAKQIAFESWPVDAGWSHHSAAITEVTKSFLEQYLFFRQQGIMSDEPPEEHRFVKFY